MSLYELTLVLKEKAKLDLPGKVKTTKDWGVRDLAYPIKKQKRAAYWHYSLELAAGEAASLDQGLRHNDQVLRYLLIKAKE